MLNIHPQAIDVLSAIKNSKTVIEVENLVKNRTANASYLLGSFFTFSYPAPSPTKSITWLKENINQLSECEMRDTLISKIENAKEHMLLLRQKMAAPLEGESLFLQIESTLHTILEQLASTVHNDELDESSFEIIPCCNEDSTSHDIPVYSSGITEKASDACRSIWTHVGGWINAPKINIFFDTAKIPEHYINTIKKLIEDPAGRLSSQESFDCMDLLCSREENKLTCETLGIGMTSKEYIEGRQPSLSVSNYFKTRFVKKAIKQNGGPPHELLFIPFVFKGSPLIEMMPGADPGHIIMITVSFSDKTVEYYDSFAYPPEEWKCYKDFCMKQELLKIKELCFRSDPQAKILSHNKKQQHDWHSCGVHVLHYMKERLSKKTFDQITSSSMENGEIQKIRIEIATLLANSQ